MLGKHRAGGLICPSVNLVKTLSSPLTKNILLY